LNNNKQKLARNFTFSGGGAILFDNRDGFDKGGFLFSQGSRGVMKSVVCVFDAHVCAKLDARVCVQKKKDVARTIGAWHGRVNSVPTTWPMEER
jgi:hypothetical protein